MAFEIKTPQGQDAITEFVLFFDRANEGRSARWPATAELHVPMLMGESPFCEDRRMQPFAAYRNGEIVARATGIIDSRHNRHWNETLGHITMFEALPDTTEAVKALMDAACQWLSEQGATAARVGFSLAGFDMPIAIDMHDVLPPSLLRQNPAHYPILLKRAGFESEKGCVDYKLKVTPQLQHRWEDSLDRARSAGYEIIPLRELEPDARVREVRENWNETFKTHWGFPPFTEAEIELLLAAMAETSVLDTSVIAVHERQSVGFVFNASDDPSHAVLADGRKLADYEKLNILAIGVKEAARGRGVNYAMAGYSYLELARRGWTHLSYTLVLDDNWGSRRTGERLGCEVCANYLVYRRNFR